MIELELLGAGADGQSLVMTDAGGERYSVPITDELRGAVRRDRPRLESVPSPEERPLRPREIQSLLRSGLTAEELARESNMDIAHIRRFEAPVAAEKEWALSRALETHVGGDRDAPVMGDLVVDRLAARGVDPASMSWSARRPGEGPWEIALTFLQGAAEHAAHWRMAPSATAVEAVDQEARWLTETAAPSPVSAVFTPLPARPEHPVDEGDADLRVTRCWTSSTPHAATARASTSPWRRTSRTPSTRRTRRSPARGVPPVRSPPGSTPWRTPAPVLHLPPPTDPTPRP